LNASGIISILIYIGALFYLIYFGNKVFHENNNSRKTRQYWENRNYEKAKGLAKLFEARNYVTSCGDTLRYRLMIPLEYDPEQYYPLVVILHDAGFPGTDNIRQLACQPTPILSSEANRKKYPSFLFVPHCPKGIGWNFYPMDSMVFEAIASLEKEFNINTKRRYVVGGSMGGHGTWHFICSRPDMFAAAIPMCGAGKPELASRIINVPVWAFHGAKDEAVPVSYTRKMIEAIKEAGGHPKYTEFPEGVHNVWPQLLRTPGVWEWFFEQENK
jgi:predicted peptidase